MVKILYAALIPENVTLIDAQNSRYTSIAIVGD